MDDTAALDANRVDDLKRVGGCGPRCVVHGYVSLMPDGVRAVVVVHGEHAVSMHAQRLPGQTYADWRNVLDSWERRVADFHREDVFASDWPVY